MAKVIKRAKGQPLPPNAIYVGRPTKWGNPFKITWESDRLWCIDQYRYWLDDKIKQGLLDPTELKGKDLACWCSPLPCHADILLELANYD